MRVSRKIPAFACGLLMVSGSVNAYAQVGRDDDEDDIVVTATPSRVSSELASTPGSVTIVDAAEIAQQAKFGNDLGEILQRSVPGFGLSSSASYSNFSTTLRGRKPAVFIDGVPVTTPLRDGGRDLRLISPLAIGQIEVIRGATALYGLGGAGGIVNYATRQPEGDGIEFQTDVAGAISLTNPGDSLNWSVDQRVSGKSGAVGFVFAGYYEQFNSLFGADGDRIPPNPQNQGGIADTDAFNLFGKVTLDLEEAGRLSLSGNYYRVEQDSEYSVLPGVGVFGSVAAPAQRVRGPGANEFTMNWLTVARYENDDVLGSKVNLQGYYGEYQARFPFFSPPLFPPNGGQSLIDAKRHGLRGDFDTPLAMIGGKSQILWGIDYSYDETFQPIERPGFPDAVFVPKMRQKSIAPFAQASLDLTDWLNIRGGFRWENAKVDVDTFSILPQYVGLPSGNIVAGGRLKYNELLLNGGLVLKPFVGSSLDALSIFAGFSQGFSVGDLGRALRSTTAASVEAFGFNAQIIDSYEAGVRYETRDIKAALSTFLSTSQFGSSFNALTLELLRAPERVWGVEGSLDVTASENLRLGTSVSWVDGKTRNVTTGVYSPLDTTRIGPVKANFYLNYAPNDDLAFRLQYTYSGRQQRFPGNPAAFGRADVESFSLIDLSVSGEVGPGRMTLAVNNLLNQKYFTPDAFRYGAANTFTQGQGATARLSYTISY